VIPIHQVTLIPGCAKFIHITTAGKLAIRYENRTVGRIRATVPD
jgi:hypothetical protein